MALATRLKKLEQPAIEAWNKAWDNFVDTLIKSVPPNAEAVWTQGERLTAEFEALPEEEKLGIAAKQDEENHRLFRLLDLEPDLWLEWVKELDQYGERIPASDEHRLKLDLSFTPSTLPKPPCDPRQMLDIMKTFDYPVDFIGHARFLFLFCLAEARAVWEAHEGRY